jgi:ankyrin repeat protein
VDAKASDGSTALIKAVGGCHTDTVRILIMHGANVNTKTKEDIMPLPLATSSDRCKDIVQLLKKTGAKIF